MHSSLVCAVTWKGSLSWGIELGNVSSSLKEAFTKFAKPLHAGPKGGTWRTCKNKSEKRVTLAGKKCKKSATEGPKHEACDLIKKT